MATLKVPTMQNIQVHKSVNKIFSIFNLAKKLLCLAVFNSVEKFPAQSYDISNAE
jgi:hypothetical protein